MKKSADKRTVRLGIVGVGSMGGVHARAILDGKVPGMTLTAICDANPSAAAARFPEVPVFSKTSEMYAADLVDAVLIATPHYTHTEIGIEALKRGLHVLIEKPISVHKADCLRLLDAYDPAKGTIFAAMFNQRTDPRYTKLRQLIQSGELGEVQRINWVITDWFRTEAYYQSGGWRATWAGEGGGVLINQCPHQLDLWQWMFGMPDAVTASCQLGRFHQIEVEDSVTAILEYTNGTQGVFVTTTGEAPGENRLTVACDRGLVVVGRDSIQLTRNEFSAAEYSRTTSLRSAPPPIWEITIPTGSGGEQHLGVLKNFAGAIMHDEPLLAPAHEGIHSVELGNAMLLSSLKSRRQPLPMDAAEFEFELSALIEAARKKTAPARVAQG